MHSHTLTYVSDLDELEVEFNIEIDYENEIVEVNTVYEEKTTTTASTRRGSAVHETYSALGILNYTVTVNGTFSYSSSSCSTTAKSGTFEKGSGTFWSSTPTLSHGNITTTKAYARISGTATMLWESSSYQLTLMCDTSGNLTSTFTRP